MFTATWTLCSLYIIVTHVIPSFKEFHSF